VRALAFVVLGLFACDSPVAPPPIRARDGVPVPVADACRIATRPELRRLTRAEYDHTVRDLLGDESAPARAFVPDEECAGFRVGLSVSPALFAQYQAAAERIASEIDVPALSGCEPADRACARAFIARFGRRAYRRPLAGDEIDALVAVFDETATRTPAAALEVVIGTMLQSPFFLYRVERTDPATQRLGAYELASALSYFLWRSMPDDALLDAAERGDLATPEGVEREARRLLDDPRSDDAIASFHEEWLEIGELEIAERDPALFPEFSPELARAMVRETRDFGVRVVRDDGRFTTLLLSPRTRIDDSLAALYGVEAPEAPWGSEIELGPERRGVLTHASVLAAHSHPDQTSPVRRGAFVRARFLCQDVPPPPDDRMVVPPPAGSAATARERLALHRSDPSCAGCHALMDPIGFGFERYDAVGRHRASEGGVAVDASGEVVASIDADGAFDGAVELAERLASSRAVSDCYATQWFRFVAGRREDPSERCALDAIRARFAETGDVRELLVAIATSDAFSDRGAAR
jgi:hypothetical protein